MLFAVQHSQQQLNTERTPTIQTLNGSKHELTQVTAICVIKIIVKLYDQKYQIILSKIGVKLFMQSLLFRIYEQFKFDTYLAPKKESQLYVMFNYVKIIDLLLFLVNTRKDLRQILSMPLLHFECPHILSKTNNCWSQRNSANSALPWLGPLNKQIRIL